MFEVLLGNKSGEIWDITQLVSSMTWKTKRFGSVGTLELEVLREGLYQHPKFSYELGDVLRVRSGTVPVFYGYLFSASVGKDGKLSLVAYDQMRYLKNGGSFAFAGSTATEIIRTVSGYFGVEVGELADTKHVIPALVEDARMGLDVIGRALVETEAYGGGMFVLYDDFGRLRLRNVEDMEIMMSVGISSLLVDFDYEASIDDDTYNRIVFVQQQEGRREPFTLEDKDNIRKWGLLQLYENVDEKLNEAQIREALQRLFTLRNREKTSLSLSALGDLRVRAGSYLNVKIPDLDLDQKMLVDECTHKFNGAASHTMELKVKGGYRVTN